ncbi:SDR family oxidoreductase [Kribbella solani]|uniref:SDR family oxidoreductase n=1 Tax=Kribbella solani TaxID=236067 RepID=UPI0029B8780E|nr:NAD(P)H-binding protein [Kribbella solani]MDX2973703.1 NAD(P)H-binding protein [Kribbella solani]
MTSILVTGGTGTLGRPTVSQLQAAGHHLRILSRNPAAPTTETPRAGSTAPDHVVADLSTGAGVAAAVEGVEVIVHLATSQGAKDIVQTKNLLAAAAGVRHLVLMSIAGIDRVPLGYYRAKLESERLVAESGTPYTILRATQFHNLLDKVLTGQRFLPLVLAPAVQLQPIAVEEVATRIAELVDAQPVNGRVADIGGPERRPVPEFARLWKQARAVRRPVVPLRLPGRIFRAYAAGDATVEGPAYGRITFAEYLR